MDEFVNIVRIPQFSVENVWEGTCRCGTYLGKAISETEAIYRATKHVEEKHAGEEAA